MPAAQTQMTLNSQKENDEVALFPKSLESTLKTLSGRQLALARKKINDVMFEVEMEGYQQCSPVYPQRQHPQMSGSDVNVSSSASSVGQLYSQLFP